jgi:putative ABC transport system ATP-binding protein
LFALNADAGTTLVLVTHDEHLASRCTRLLRLDSGRLVADA